MSRGRWASVAGALAIAAVAAVTAGCGGGGSALALDPVAAAATKTAQAGAARVRLVVTFSGPRTHGRTLTFTGRGAIDGTSSKLTVGPGDSAARSFLPAAVSHTPLQEISLEQNGGYVVYVQPGALAHRLPGGKHWIELNLSQLAQARGLDLGTLLSGSGLQPADLLSLLKAEGAKIQNLGPATVGGVATTHYRVTVDVARALKATGLSGPHLARLAARMSKVPADVWIGKDGLVHQVRLSVAVAKKHGTARLGLSVNVYDYGASVAITAPPSGDVFDATQLALGLGSLSR